MVLAKTGEGGGGEVGIELLIHDPCPMLPVPEVGAGAGLPPKHFNLDKSTVLYKFIYRPQSAALSDFASTSIQHTFDLGTCPRSSVTLDTLGIYPDDITCACHHLDCFLCRPTKVSDDIAAGLLLSQSCVRIYLLNLL